MKPKFSSFSSRNSGRARGLTLRALVLPAAFWVGAIAGQLGFAQSASQGQQQSPYDIERVAPGTPAPAFTLPDSEGKPRTLSSFRGAPAVIVFYRGSW